MTVFIKSDCHLYGVAYTVGQAEVSRSVYEALSASGIVDQIESERVEEVVKEEKQEKDTMDKRLVSFYKALERAGISKEDAKLLSVEELVSIKGIGKATAELFLNS